MAQDAQQSPPRSSTLWSKKYVQKNALLPGEARPHRPTGGPKRELGAFDRLFKGAKVKNVNKKKNDQEIKSIKDVPDGLFCLTVKINAKELETATGPVSPNLIESNAHNGDGKPQIGLGDVDVTVHRYAQLRVFEAQPFMYRADKGDLVVVYKPKYQVKYGDRLDANGILLYANRGTFDKEVGWNEISDEKVSELVKLGTPLPKLIGA